MEKRARKNEIDMTHGPLAGKILLFTIPVMLSSLLNLFFNAADVVVLGRYVGDAALGAVGSTGSIVNLLASVMSGLSVAVNVVVAHDIGAGNDNAVRRAVHTSVLLGLCTGVGIMLIGVVLSRPLLLLTGSVPDVIDLAALYMRIYFCGLPASAVYHFVAGILRAKGDTRRPLYILTAAGVMNVTLNIFFVRVLGMTVDGVALATIISQYFSAVSVLLLLVRETGPLKLEFRRLRFSAPIVRRIVIIGIPSALHGAIFSISNMQIQTGINSFNDTVLVAACSAAGNVEGFVYSAMNSFHQACVTFSSRNYGAGKTKRIDRTLQLCALFVTVTGLVGGFGVRIFGHSILSFYAPGREDVINAALERITIDCLPYFLCGLMDVLVGALRGIGYSVLSTAVSVTCCCGMRILWVHTVFRAFHKPWVLFLSMPVSWLLSVIGNGIAFLIVRKRAYRRVSGDDEPALANGTPAAGSKA